MLTIYFSFFNYLKICLLLSKMNEIFEKRKTKYFEKWIPNKKKPYSFNIVNDILEKSIKALVIRLKNVLH